MTRSWGCPRCGHLESWVADTARDEDGYVIRLRRCAACEKTWPTEEVPLAAGSYYARKDSGSAETRRRWWRMTVTECCGHEYHGTNIGRHQRTAKHKVEVVHRTQSMDI